ncbi:hypothetical protein PF005_g25060 [Phytophthora fragariae]|uniref:Uncharacterized protein n=2 Tax=Phytophthora TaxID=4783 RepID=A0A6A3RC17_9STRA|nr:hypothetical protein PF009_g25796 [Phytophthora fragariae]KAE8999301.1 hypothetical protein PR002_g18496 [Phytophthora rubi]KAE8976238.1 hypothetical protein PF011_g24135 [Phytophthora fragariae]KAE9074163.1 hypothetical protein PF010_g24789 [Phytophthora fragariae]KAE9093691.1 hypothetical protein PF006_g24379 [Phytophthora fragariae]
MRTLRRTWRAAARPAATTTPVAAVSRSTTTLLQPGPRLPHGSHPAPRSWVYLNASQTRRQVRQRQRIVRAAPPRRRPCCWIRHHDRHCGRCR